MKCRVFLPRFALAVCALTIYPMLANAGDVSGDIASTTWTAANSPYRVTDIVTIPSGTTLTIEAGVDVVFDADVQFIVEGAIHTHGTESDSVRFYRGVVDTWRGIRISGGDSSSFAYTRISGGNARAPEPNDRGGGLYVAGETTRVSMTNCLVSGNTASMAGGGIANNGAVATLINCYHHWKTN